jgi:hypothetical protein
MQQLSFFILQFTGAFSALAATKAVAASESGF